MAVKDFFRRLRPVQLYLVLFFTTAYFIVEIVSSHVTHSLTLLLDAYHTLCNIVALIGCVASVKYAHRENCRGGGGGDEHCSGSGSSAGGSSIRLGGEENGSTSLSASNGAKESCSERRMKNTFGWARIDVLTMLVCRVLLASFCFSLLVEALQTLVHIDHLDEMHHPLPVMCIGIAGVLLNGFCYATIGGYMFNPGLTFRDTRDGGGVLFQRTTATTTTAAAAAATTTTTGTRTETAADAEGEERLSGTRNARGSFPPRRRQSFREMLRDVFGCFLIVAASLIVHFTDARHAKFVDPAFAVVSASLLLVLSYPYMRESGLILLQTIPNHINIVSLKKELLAAFPGIVSVHDLHVWHLAGENVICTAHIIFFDPMVYASITDRVTDFFLETGITQVSIQPEFHASDSEPSPCLIRCQAKRCQKSQCCAKQVSGEDRRIGQRESSTSDTTGNVPPTERPRNFREAATFAIDVEIVEVEASSEASSEASDAPAD